MLRVSANQGWQTRGKEGLELPRKNPSSSEPTSNSGPRRGVGEDRALLKNLEVSYPQRPPEWVWWGFIRSRINWSAIHRGRWRAIAGWDSCSWLEQGEEERTGPSGGPRLEATAPNDTMVCICAVDLHETGFEALHYFYALAPRTVIATESGGCIVTFVRDRPFSWKLRRLPWPMDHDRSTGLVSRAAGISSLWASSNTVPAT